MTNVCSSLYTIITFNPFIVTQMSEITSFYNNKTFKKVKEQIERRTTHGMKAELVNKALSTKYFIENMTRSN